MKIFLLAPEVVNEVILGDPLSLHSILPTALLLLTSLVDALSGQALELLLALLFTLAFLSSLDLIFEAVLHIDNIIISVLSDPRYF